MFCSKKIFTSIFIFLVTTVLVVPRVLASDQFEINYHTTYTIKQDGVTQVNQKVDITNLQSDVIPTDYSITLNLVDIYGIEVKDSKDNLDFDTIKEGSTTTIKIKLRNQQIGDGRKNSFYIDYNTETVAKKVGKVWTVTTPPVANLDLVNLYDVKLVIPNSFGNKIYLAPKAALEETSDKTSTYTFNKEILQNTGITGAFGTQQELDFNLRYHLKNTGLLASVQKIALPPEEKDIQQINYTNIDPKPDEIITDEDGNYLALYKVPGKSEIQINLVGTARITTKQLDPTQGGAFNDIPANIRSTYTKSDKFWDIKAANVKDISKLLYKDTNNVTQNALEIYNYLITNTNYDSDVNAKENTQRKGASKALEELDTWTSIEFSDVFITLARSMGIPSREVDGFAFPKGDANFPVDTSVTNQDLIHAWVQYYDPSFGWVNIDPMWGKTSKLDYFTKLDTNHLIFSYKGLDSEFPLPAGAYKFNKDDKQIQIDFTKTDKSKLYEHDIKVNPTFGWNIFKYLFGYKCLEVTNLNGNTVYNFSNTGVNVLPFQKQQVYVKNNINDYYFYGFDGNKIAVK